MLENVSIKDLGSIGFIINPLTRFNFYKEDLKNLFKSECFKSFLNSIDLILEEQDENDWQSENYEFQDSSEEEFEQEEEASKAFGVPSQASTEAPTMAPSIKKARALRKKPKASDIELGENVNEPFEEKLKREKGNKPKVVINAPEEKPAELPKAFSYVQEPVGLQERPPQASPILSFSNKDFIARPMKGDVSSLPEKDRLDPAPVKPEPESLYRYVKNWTYVQVLSVCS
jgi:hypothetical protein